MSKRLLTIKALRNLKELFSTSRSCPRCKRGFADLDPRLFSFNSKHGWCPRCFGTGLELPGFDEEQSGEEIWWNDWWGGPERVCTECKGQRLRSEALSVRLRDQSISAYTSQSVVQAHALFEMLAWKGREQEIAKDIVSELLSRLQLFVKGRAVVSHA